MCVVCVLCLIVVPLPPDKNPFAVKIKIIIVIIFVNSRIYEDPPYIYGIYVISLYISSAKDSSRRFPFNFSSIYTYEYIPGHPNVIFQSKVEKQWRQI
jgi:hypothetical protein